MKNLASIFGIVLLAAGLRGQIGAGIETRNCQNLSSGQPNPACTPAAVPEGFSPLNLAENYYLTGNAWYEKGDLDKALDAFDQAIRIYPNLSTAYWARGAIRDRKGQYDQAIADYSEAIRIDPHLAEAYNNRGIVWDEKGDWDKAVADYSEAILINPDLADAYYGRGTSWYGKDEYDRAIADYSEAIRLNPNYSVAYRLRGIAWDAKGEYPKAIADYGRAISIDPKYARAYYSRGFTHYIHHKYQLSLKDFVSARQLDSKDAYAALGLAMARMRSGVPGYSVTLNKQAEALGEDWPMPAVWFYVGRLTAEQLLAAAKNPDDRKQQKQLCEAEFYLGEWQLLHGMKRAAIDNLKKAQSEGGRNSYEYLGAVEELKRMAAAASPRAAH
jgi:tetratricopeptide (TPR) repeat protein